jgi:hypothetical protein
MRKLLILSPFILSLVLLFSISSIEPVTSSEYIEMDVPTGFYRTRAEDCPSCHYSVAETLESGKHSGVPCDTCHDPNVISELVLIVDCTTCHGNRHNYTYPLCIDCHDAHATGFQHDISKSLCQDCHANETVELDMGPHSWQSCTTCHQDHSIVHNGCDSCHGHKHSELTPGGYSYPECLQCHEPMNASFSHEMSSDICQDCHSSEFHKLQSGGHSSKECTECHAQHQVVRTYCDDCHGQEHGYAYPKCLECHDPMLAQPGSPEYQISPDSVLFALFAVIASIAVSAVLIVHLKRKEE